MCVCVCVRTRRALWRGGRGPRGFANCTRRAEANHRGRLMVTWMLRKMHLIVPAEQLSSWCVRVPHQHDAEGREILSLEHTASLFEENTDIHRQPARAIGQPPTTSDHNVRAPATGSLAAIPRKRLFQRVWPRMMIGVMFVLEVAWIVFLAHSSIALVRFLS